MSLLLLFNASTGIASEDFTCTIAGTDRTRQVDRHSIEITLKAREVATASFDCLGFVPSLRSLVTFRIANDASPASYVNEFTGYIVKRSIRYDKLTQRAVWSATAVGYDFDSNGVLVTASFAAQSATAIAQSLLTTYAPTVTQTHVEAGLPTVGPFDFVNVKLKAALQQVVDPFAGGVYIDAENDAHVFSAETDETPDSLNTTSPLFRTFRFSESAETIANRILVIGKGARTTTETSAGATSIEVDDTSIFSATGGSAFLEDGQVITYTGVSTTAGVSAPAAPTVAKAYYDVSEARTISSWSSSVNTVTANTSAAHGFSVGDAILVTGTDLNALGPHIVASTPSSTQFTYTRQGIGTSSGTGTNMRVRKATGITSMQMRSGKATVTTYTAHGFVVGQAVKILFTNLDNSGWRGTFTVLTTPSTTTFTIDPGGYPADSSIYEAGATLHAACLAASSGPMVGTYAYKLTFASHSDETLASVASSSVTVAGVTPPSAANASFTGASGGSLTASSTYHYGFSLVTSVGESPVGTAQSIILSVGQTQVTIGIPAFFHLDPRVNAINIWRSRSNQGASDLRYVGTLDVGSDWNTDSYVDQAADSALGSLYSAVEDTTGGAVKISSIPTSGTATVAVRNIYRTVASGSVYKAAGAVTAASQTGAIDAVDDDDLGSDEPSEGTLTVGSVTGIPASGDGSLTADLRSGALVRIYAVREDASSQTTYGQRDREIRDDTLASVEALEARGDAELELDANPRSEGSYVSSDPLVRPGRQVAVSMSSEWGLTGTFTIQSVTIRFVPDREKAERMVSFSSQDANPDLVRLLRQLAELAVRAA